jgi:ubiquinone/menaquinone biosynthesis C-methylase UbiE
MTADAGEAAIDFSDGLAYERFMGRWSRAVGALFLAWVAPPAHGRWLEIGCGTGAFTGLVLRMCSPDRIIATDPSTRQIEIASRQLDSGQVDFRVVTGDLLPFADRSFDVIAGALVLNFVPDRTRTLNEMRRVGRTGAIVAAYVWDFAAGRAPNSAIALGLSRMGTRVPPIPGTDGSTLESLRSSFETAGYQDVAVTSFEVAMEFADFDEFWQSQMPSFSPLTKIIGSLPPTERRGLKALVRRQVLGRGGAISHSARANAVKARVA